MPYLHAIAYLRPRSACSLRHVLIRRLVLLAVLGGLVRKPKHRHGTAACMKESTMQNVQLFRPGSAKVDGAQPRERECIGGASHKHKRCMKEALCTAGYCYLPPFYANWVMQYVPLACAGSAREDGSSYAAHG